MSCRDIFAENEQWLIEYPLSPGHVRCMAAEGRTPSTVVLSILEDSRQ